MRYIEQGIDKYDVTCWYVLDNAELIGRYYTLAEALQFFEARRGKFGI